MTTPADPRPRVPVDRAALVDLLVELTELRALLAADQPRALALMWHDRAQRVRRQRDQALQDLEACLARQQRPEEVAMADQPPADDPARVAAADQGRALVRDLLAGAGVNPADPAQRTQLQAVAVGVDLVLVAFNDADVPADSEAFMVAAGIRILLRDLLGETDGGG
jgi:hypothetical protein